jgi:transcriptional regulator with XRE-family HTH domain
MATAATPDLIGPLLRDWRQRRHRSQLDLALDAGVSARHLSFVETGRSRPSPRMIVRLAEQLDIPHSDRNRLLLAAGYAPLYAERALDDPEMAPVREAIGLVLAGHEPYPALVVDRHWNMVAANAAVPMLLGGVAPELLEPPVNVLRVSLHPNGMAPRIANLGEWRAHLVDRLERQVALTGDPALRELAEEARGYPDADDAPVAPTVPHQEIVASLRLRTDDGELAFFSTVATFGTAVEITTSELSIESFFPADEATAAALRDLPRG